MAKKTEKSADGTSFHGTVINATINEITRSIGEPQYDAGRDVKYPIYLFGKVTVEWTCETNDGDIFTSIRCGFNLLSNITSTPNNSKQFVL